MPLALGYRALAMLLLSSERLDFNINASRQIKLHQSVDRLRCWVKNVHQSLVRPNLKLLA